MSNVIQIVYAEEKYFKSFHFALNEVARERIYIEMLVAPPLENVVEFQKGLIQRGGPAFYAIDSGNVVGWADIFPEDNPRMSHRGSLGMGLLPSYRGKGIGSQLLSAAIEKAKKFGLEKIELNVYTHNTRAVALYKKMGFIEEGLIKKYRKIDGQYYDSLQMALFLK